MEKGLLEKYEENNLIRALVNLVPNIGGSLDILLSMKGSKWREERIKALLTDLDERIAELEDSKILEQISESEEFYDLLVQSMNAVIKTRHQEKIKCYSNILINNLIDTASKKYTELLIVVLDSLSINEIEYLSYLKNNSNEVTYYLINNNKIIWPKYLSHIENTGRVDEIPNDALLKFNTDLIWKLLTDKNLIYFETKKDFQYLNYTYKTNWQSMSSSVTASEKTTIRITEFGNEFINWVIS